MAVKDRYVFIVLRDYLHFQVTPNFVYAGNQNNFQVKGLKSGSKFIKEQTFGLKSRFCAILFLITCYDLTDYTGRSIRSNT